MATEAKRTFTDATATEIDAAVNSSWQAFQQYRQRNLKERADFLRTIAVELQAISDELLETTHRETNLTKPRLQGELNRTIFQLTSYAQACEEGTWLEVRIDTADANRNPPKPDVRKMLVPLGPVVVFGASNFPFAYSTAGGDTACALAAGCPVIIKAHPAHAHTSELVAKAGARAAQKCGLPAAVFTHLHGASFEAGKALVQHPLVKAVGFTGSFQGGKALFDLANGRPEPIPVFAEMGSTNPVFLLPGKVAQDTNEIAEMYAASITQSVGQFCTNPGILVGREGAELDLFNQLLAEKIRAEQPAKMLHPGIAKSFREKRAEVLQQDGVAIAATTATEAAEDESIPTLAQTTARAFLQNGRLHEEVFGPYSLLVVCKTEDEMLEVARHLHGQLTISVLATEADAAQHAELISVLQQKCGRLVFNGVPTGVEVCLAMHHGGPYPSTTDSRYTSVGADGIRRFARPLCFQGWPNELLPEELKNENPLRLWRTVNNKLTNTAL